MKKIFSFEQRDIAKRVIKSLEEGTKILVPLCPDYIPGDISNGISKLMFSAVKVVKEIQEKYPKSQFEFLIADTEEDILDSFDRSKILSSKEKLSSLVKKEGINANVFLFLEKFPNWHTKQYALEALIRLELGNRESSLKKYLDIFTNERNKKYALIYDKNITYSRTTDIQIRHYAQYMLISKLMEELELFTLLNYYTENLRAVTKYHSFLPQKRKVDLIVY